MSGPRVGLVIVAAAVGGLVACSNTPNHSPLGAHPAHIVVDGKTLERVARADGADVVFVDAHDPRVLHVRHRRLSEKDVGQSPVCASLQTVKPFAYIADQNFAYVTVAIGGYREPAPRQRSGARPMSVICGGEIVGYDMFTVRLNAALGGRTVRDALATEPLQVISESSVPVPRYIPSSYVARGVTLGFGLRSNVPERVYRNGPFELDILVGHSIQDFALAQTPNTSVHNHPAISYTDGPDAVLAWTESNKRAYEIIDTQADQSDGAGGIVVLDPDLSPADLIRIAESF